MKCGPEEPLQLADPCTKCEKGKLCMDSENNCKANPKLEWKDAEKICVEKGGAPSTAGRRRRRRRRRRPKHSHSEGDIQKGQDLDPWLEIVRSWFS